MMKSRKQLFGHEPHYPAGKARSVSVSLFPSHLALLHRREKETAVHRSILIQLLLEMDERSCLLRQELLNRIPPASGVAASPAPATAPAEGRKP